MKQRLGAFFLLGLITACAGNPSTQNTDDAVAIASGVAPALSVIPESGLGSQELASGECGLFLWSKTDPSKFIFFSRATSGNALFAQSEKPLELTQEGAGGDIFGQFTTRTSYRAASGLQLSLSFEPGDFLTDGQRIDNGLLTIVDQEGWRTKLPVLGVRACQREQ